MDDDQYGPWVDPGPLGPVVEDQGPLGPKEDVEDPKGPNEVELIPFAGVDLILRQIVPHSPPRLILSCP